MLQRKIDTRDVLDVATQTNPEDVSTSQTSSKNEEQVILCKITGDTPHARAYSYIDWLATKYPSDEDRMYELVNEMMCPVGDADTFSEGLDQAIAIKYSELKSQDKDSYLLILFLEVFYETYALKLLNYPMEKHEETFKYALSLALKVTENPNILRTIYLIDGYKSYEDL